MHGPYHVRASYANGATVYISEKYPNGLRFIGEDGWIWVTRGNNVPAGRRELPGPQALDASDRRMLADGHQGRRDCTCTPARTTITTWTG